LIKRKAGGRLHRHPPAGSIVFSVSLAHFPCSPSFELPKPHRDEVADEPKVPLVPTRTAGRAKLQTLRLSQMLPVSDHILVRVPTPDNRIDLAPLAERDSEHLPLDAGAPAVHGLFGSSIQ